MSYIRHLRQNCQILCSSKTLKNVITVFAFVIVKHIYTVVVHKLSKDIVYGFKLNRYKIDKGGGTIR